VASTELTMSELVEVELVEGPAVFALNSELRSFGYLLICDRCKDSREPIGAILVIPGPCATPVGNKCQNYVGKWFKETLLVSRKANLGRLGVS
jgi:hypothetical protein